jgi:hypothetical protein
MSFGEALEDAGHILKLLGLLTAIPILIIMSQNMANPNFDMIGTAEIAIYNIIDAIIPAILTAPGLLLLIAVALFLADNDFGH